MSLKTEIFEQPAVLGRLLDREQANVGRIAAALKDRDVQYIYLAARGTSDNAGRYAVYLFGAQNRLPVALAAPSLFTRYDQPPSMKGALVIGISQSGQSPDVVSVLAEARRTGQPTLAITNRPGSPLAQAADFVIDLQAGEEKAVAATKTYTAELMAIALLSATLHTDETALRELRAVPEAVQAALDQEDSIRAAARHFVDMQQGVVLGRGYHYSTAFEWSLKLKEMAYVQAEPYSPADFQHGPVALLDGAFPVLAVITAGKVFQSGWEQLQRLKRQQKAELAILSDQPEALALADVPLRLPERIPEWIAPLAAIVPAQLFAYFLTLEKGYDVEKPRSIQKVTETE